MINKRLIQRKGNKFGSKASILAKTPSTPGQKISFAPSQTETKIGSKDSVFSIAEKIQPSVNKPFTAAARVK